MSDFAALQRQLGAALDANRPGSTVPHVLVALPSFSVGESLLSHYAERIPALEHRYLHAQLMLARIDSCEMVFVSCEAPAPEVQDHYLSLVPASRRDSVRKRLRIFVVPDRTHRSVAAKLLDRPDLVAELRAALDGRVAFIEPWNVTSYEVELAVRLGAPINGTAPHLWPLGFKSSGRRLFAEAGVPVPAGREDVRSVDDVVAAAADIRARHPAAPGVVVKTDDSGAGDGNRVISFAEADGPTELRAVVEALPSWYLADLSAGGVVEELVTGEAFTCPSVQVDITPDGTPVVLATHEQVCGGPGGQVYLGCRFPAAPDYAARLGRYGYDVGRALAERGAVGRFSVDFAAARRPEGDWEVYALEINLRKGGTTHPFCALRNLVPGRYDVAAGVWVADDGSTRSYVSTDNLVDPVWRGRPPREVIARIAEAGLQLDPARGTGVVLHMLSSLAIDGRCGLTAIGTSPERAQDLYAAAADVLSAPVSAGSRLSPQPT